VQTDLINQDTFEVISLNFEMSEYHGVDEGESWSEGDLSSTKSTAEVDPAPTWSASRRRSKAARRPRGIQSRCR